MAPCQRRCSQTGRLISCNGCFLLPRLFRRDVREKPFSALVCKHQIQNAVFCPCVGKIRPTNIAKRAGTRREIRLNGKIRFLNIQGLLAS